VTCGLLRLRCSSAGRLVEQSVQFLPPWAPSVRRSKLEARSRSGPADAVATYEKLISLLEGIKDQSNVNDQRAVAETYSFIYDEMIASLYSLSKQNRDLVDDRRASEAFKYAEENRARQFAQSWGRTFVEEMRKTLPATVQAEEHLLSVRESRENAAAAATLGPKTHPARSQVDRSADDSRHKLETDKGGFHWSPASQLIRNTPLWRIRHASRNGETSLAGRGDVSRIQGHQRCRIRLDREKGIGPEK
jgi:hypothetical protein